MHEIVDGYFTAIYSSRFFVAQNACEFHKEMFFCKNIIVKMLYTDLYFSSDCLSNSKNIKCNISILKLLQIFDYMKIYTTKNVYSYILCQTDIGHSIYLVHVSKVDQSIHGISEYFVHGLAILCMSNVGQSIHGIRGYFAKGYPWVGHTMYVQCWSEYPWNPQIFCQGGIHGLAILCMSNVGQSIHGIRGYFAKGVSMGWPYYVCPMLVRVSMESTDTLPKGYPWVGHTMYVQCWSEYPWNPRILCQGGIHDWPYYVCPMLVRVSMVCQKRIHGLGTMYIQWWSVYDTIKG